MSSWRENINTFASSIGVLLGLVMIDIGLMPFLTPYTTQLLIVANVIGFTVIAGGLIYFWQSRIPKIDLEEAERIALDHIKLKPRSKSATIDRSRESKLVGQKYVIPVIQYFEHGANYPWVCVDARNGEITT